MAATRFVLRSRTVLLCALIGLAANGPAAAQAPAMKIAYDQCAPDLDTWMVRCDVRIRVDEVDTMVIADATSPKWSPDGSSLALANSSGDILVVRLADGRVTNLTNHPAFDWAPAWSRTGKIAFASDRDG